MSAKLLDRPSLKDYPRPSITPSQIITFGFGTFVFASLWPPLILIAAAVFATIAPQLFYENDDGESRRRLYREFLKRDDLPEALKCRDVQLEEGYWVNSRGMCLFTSIMTPKDGTPIKSVACFCHGFLGSATYLTRVDYQRFVKAGIAVVTIDYEGHGLSDGLQGLIPSWDTLVGDTLEFFEETLLRKFPATPAFLCGESMGGAVSFSIYERKPCLWKGVVLVAPMCKIKEDMLPPAWVVQLLTAIVGTEGTTPFSRLPIAPSKKSLTDEAYQCEERRRLAKDNPLYYGNRKPRLASARELLNICEKISSNLKSFDAPFIVQHGLCDVVTDPDLSVALYEESSSKDKELKLYEGMWHCINTGESAENIDIVLQDSIDWILMRS